MHLWFYLVHFCADVLNSILQIEVLLSFFLKILLGLVHLLLSMENAALQVFLLPARHGLQAVRLDLRQVVLDFLSLFCQLE